jgi:hypothetical protein
MTKLLKFFMLGLFFLFFTGLVCAQSFDIEIVSIKDRIIVDEEAEFDVTIHNSGDTEEEYMIKKAGYPFWDMFTKPLISPITLIVPPHSSKSLKFFVKPLYISSVDTFTLNVGIVKQSTNEEKKVPITIGIKSTEPLIGGYIPTVLGIVSVTPEKIDPRDEFKIRIALNNQNVINYSNLTVKIEGNLVNDVLYVPLGPKEDKNIDIKKKLSDDLPPQKDSVVVTVLFDDRVIVNPTRTQFEFTDYFTEEKIPKESSFLKITKGLKVHSNNKEYKGTIKIETSTFSNLFTSTTPKSEIVKQGDKKLLVFEVVLDENGYMEVYSLENYRPLVVIIIVAILTVILYFMFRSPLVVTKSTVSVGMSEGGVSGAKVVVRVKNRSKNRIDDIEATDYVPHIAHVEKDVSIGSMQPHAVLKHPKKGVMIRWKIEAIEPGDERVLSYKMKSRLAILGEFNLPSASARAKVGRKLIISNSNRVTVNG